MTELEQTEASKPTRSPLWMRILLLASLAVNLLIVGVVVGTVTSSPGDPERGERLRGARDLAPPPFVLAIEREDRRALLRSLREATDSEGRDRAQVRADLQSILEALRSDSFEPDAVRSLLGAERSRSRTRQEAGEDLLVDYLTALSPEERRAYADRLERILRRVGQR